MGKHEKKDPMSSIIQSQSNKSLYEKVWETASSVVMAATGDVPLKISRSINGSADSNIASKYESQRIKGISGNWNVISPKALTKQTSGR